MWDQKYIVLLCKDNARLVLKYAIRNKWQDIYNILDKKGLIDHTKTYLINLNYELYESKIIETDKQFVRWVIKFLKYITQL